MLALTPFLDVAISHSRSLLYLCPKMYFCAKRASKIYPAQRNAAFHLQTFFDYDVTYRTLWYDLIYSTVRKWTIWEKNKPMETTMLLLSSGWLSSPGGLSGQEFKLFKLRYSILRIFNHIKHCLNLIHFWNGSPAISL